MGWQSDCYIFQGLWFPYQVGWNGPGKEYCQLGREYNSTLPYQKTFGPSSTYGVLGDFGQVCFFSVLYILVGFELWLGEENVNLGIAFSIRNLNGSKSW